MTHSMTIHHRLKQQLAFIWEIDKLKNIFRQTYLLDENRKENDAEHSWHIAMMAVLLQEYANEDVDLLRIIKMMLLHDIVEIDAGDTYCYDEVANESKRQRELEAANRIFNILPEDQAREFRDLWDEFEARETNEAQFARALDRLQPMMHNYLTKGRSWREHGVTATEALKQNREIEDGSTALWEFVEEMVRDGVEQGYFSER